jgi:uncharacterized phage protein (TIGR02220 family)
VTTNDLNSTESAIQHETSTYIPGGYVLLARKSLSSPLMDMTPLTVKLWHWMLLKASHKDHGNLKRGRLFTTIEEMRNAMSWKSGYRREKPSKDQIRSSYGALTEATMVTTTKTTRGMIITICNYHIYQDPSAYGAHSGAHNGHAMELPTSPHYRQEGKQEEKNIVDLQAPQVLEHLNQVTGKKFRKLGHIPARLKDGCSVEDCKRVIDTKAQDPHFQANPKYMNPDTLFRPTNFDKYLNEANAPEPKVAARNPLAAV